VIFKQHILELNITIVMPKSTKMNLVTICRTLIERIVSLVWHALNIPVRFCFIYCWSLYPI